MLMVASNGACIFSAIGSGIADRAFVRLSRDGIKGRSFKIRFISTVQRAWAAHISAATLAEMAV
jgi:hypothetical protein